MSRKTVMFTRRAATASLLAGLAACTPHSIGPDGQPIAANYAPDDQRKRITPPELFWADYFEDVSKGAILINISERWLVYWHPGGYTYDAFPIAVPLNRDLTKTGSTRIVRRKEGPEWRPTPDMRRRMPDLPEYVGPGPDNPLGTHALYLSWTYYAIHGTNNPASIGTSATSGCFRMHPDDIIWLYGRAEIGTPVRVVGSLDGSDRLHSDLLRGQTKRYGSVPASAL